MRVQRGRGRRRGRRPLPGGPPDRRRPRPPGAARARRGDRRARGLDRRRQPDGRRPRRGHHGQRFRATGRSHFATLDDGTPCPTQVVRTIGGRGLSRSVVGQKVRWVLEAMHGPEFAGSRIARYEVDAQRRRRRRSTASAVDGRRARDRPRGAARGAAHAGRRGRDVQHPARTTRRCARCSSGCHPTPGIGWRTLGRGRRRERPAGAVGGRRLDRERAPAGRGRRGDGTWSVETGGRRAHAKASGASSTAATAATPTTTRRPTEDLVDRPARVGDGHRRPNAGRCGPAFWSRRDLPLAGPRAIGDDAVVQPAQRRDRRHRGPHDARAAAPASASCACAPSSTTGAATTACARTSRCPQPVDHSDAECAFTVVTRGLTTEGGPHETAAADVRLPPVRRRVERRGSRDGSARGPPRRPARVRARRRGPRARAHAAAGDRVPLACRDLAAAEPGRSARPARGSAAASARSRWSTRCCPTAAPGRTRTSTPRADEVLVPLERVRGGGVRGASRPVTGRPLRVDGAAVSAVLREPGGLVVRLFNPAPRATTVARSSSTARPPPGGSSTCSAGPRSSSRASSSSRANRIATLRLD